jgi:hypothetical protein
MLAPSEIQSSRCTRPAAGVVVLTEGTITPARIAPTPRLPNAVAAH